MEATDELGATALMYAVHVAPSSAAPTLAAMLLKRDANPDAKRASDGLDPRALAERALALAETPGDCAIAAEMFVVAGAEDFVAKAKEAAVEPCANCEVQGRVRKSRAAYRVDIGAVSDEQ